MLGVSATSCRFIALFAVAAGGLVAAHTGRRGSTAVKQAPTIYGKGREIHLLPDFGPLGAQVTVYGRGYKPHAKVKVYYAPGGDALGAVVTARVGSNGAFKGTFKMACNLMPFRGPRRCRPRPPFPILLYAVGPGRGRASNPGNSAVFCLTWLYKTKSRGRQSLP